MASISPINTAAAHSRTPSAGGSTSPQHAFPPKNVAFELLFPESPQRRARLPMRVSIYPHDSTESIVTTVKNFYGLYSGPNGSQGVSFEDQHSNTLIARYENFHSNMVVYVRVIDEMPSPASFVPQYAGSPPAHAAYHGNGPSQAPYTNGLMSAPEVLGRRSTSPDQSHDRHTPGINGKRSRSRASRSQADHSDVNGYSSGDDSMSAKIKEQLGNTDISVENIVQGGRRKRAKFESSELPLFAPPQMPAATSNPSVSPARRADHHRLSMPYVPQSHNPFTHPRTMQSPRGYGGLAQADGFATPAGRPARGSISYVGAGAASGMGALPTPDPTVGSCMSEEDKDVAIQLMRLGDMSNVSHGRTSTSTQDETFSGKADAASSTGATSDGESESEDELPPARRQKLDDGASKLVYQTTEAHFTPSDEMDPNDLRQIKPKAIMKKPSILKPIHQKPKSSNKVKKLPPLSTGAESPDRKQSVASTGSLQPGDDDHPDLSSKPRCQRCRKSKKGCDRQRPCSRCKDAGLSADQCVSEDEGNGRKGRYGRHMGVPVKVTDVAVLTQPSLLPAAPIESMDKNKKRKR